MTHAENSPLKKFGIIGYPLSHSFSPVYFEQKFKNENIRAQYDAYPLENILEYRLLIDRITLAGLNVTLPYKQKILPFLNEIDDIARAVGAVNAIKFADGKSKGYNTDVHGFELSLLQFIKTPENVQGALILGSGGASLAVSFVLDKLRIPYLLVSRNESQHLNYSNLDKNIMDQNNLIINTTPLGMYPAIDTKPDLPYDLLNSNYFLYDLVYNPEKTIFLTEGLHHGCKIKNGHDMLILQAEKSWEIWNQPEM